MMRRRFTLLLSSACVAGGFFFTQHVAGAKVAPPKTVTFNEVAPIFYKSCAECHRPGEAAPFSVLSYKETRPWAKSIREKVVNRTMPPWHADPHYGEFKNDRRLSQAEIDTIVAWVEQGAKEGDPKDLPPVPKFAEGWAIGQPDLIIPIPEEFTYKGGADEYQYFDVPTNFTEDKYVQMVEARPGNRKIVHHILAFIVPPGTPNMGRMSAEQRYKAMEAALKNSPMYRDGYLLRLKPDQPVYDDGCDPANPRRGGANENILTGYAPGHNADIFAPGTGRRIPAGATIRFQIHYSNQTLGAKSEEKDRSAIGLVFAKTPPPQLIVSNSIGNVFFKIPAGAENHRVTACRTFRRDTTIYGLMPHMHLRGKSMEYKLIYPDGRSEILLSVPKWDFGWQTNYLLKEPKFVPRGSRMMITAYFDNSAKNKFNPDPTKDVRYGEPTYDEMMLAFLDFVTHQPPVAQLDPRVLDSYAGRYEVAPNIVANVTRSGNALVVQVPMASKMEFVPESETKFFLRGGDADASFVRNERGEVVEVVLEMGSRTIRAKRMKDAAAAGGDGQ